MVYAGGTHLVGELSSRAKRHGKFRLEWRSACATRRSAALSSSPQEFSASPRPPLVRQTSRLVRPKTTKLQGRLPLRTSPLRRSSKYLQQSGLLSLRGTCLHNQQLSGLPADSARAQ